MNLDACSEDSSLLLVGSLLPEKTSLVSVCASIDKEHDHCRMKLAEDACIPGLIDYYGLVFIAFSSVYPFEKQSRCYQKMSVMRARFKTFPTRAPFSTWCTGGEA